MYLIFQKIHAILSNRKPLVLLFVILLICFAVFRVFNANLEEDITKILPSNNQIEKFNKGFLESELSNRIVFHITQDLSKPANPDKITGLCDAFVKALESSEKAEDIKSITHKVDQSAFQSVSDGILEHLPIFLTEQDYIEIEKLSDQEEIDDRINGAYKALVSPASFAFKKFIRNDPLGFSNLVFSQLSNFQLDDNFELHNGYIMTKEKKELLFFLSPASSAQESTRNANLFKEVDEIKSKLLVDEYADLDIKYFGGPAISVANASRIKKDVTLTVTIALLSLLFLISYFYRDFRIFHYILIPVVAGAALALILISYLKSSISIISIGVGSVLLGITIDYALHLFTHFRKKADVNEVLKDVSAPLLISSLTTASAFLCLYLVRSEALHDLGLFAALSVLCVAVLSLIILPLLFKNKNAKQSKRNIIDKIADYPFHQKNWLVWGLTAITLFCSFFALSTSFETDLNKVNYMTPDLLEAEARINKISDATRRGIYLVSMGENLDEVLESSQEVYAQLQELKAQNKIESFTSANQLLVSKSEQKRRIDRWNNYWTDQKKEKLKDKIAKASIALKFKPEAFDGFSKMLDKKYELSSAQDLGNITQDLLSDYINEEEGKASSMTMIRVEPEQKPLLHELFGDKDEIAIIDKEYLVHQFVDTLKEDFSKLVWISLLLVFFILHLVYGRAELAVIAFVPIVFSWIITLGLMNLFNLKFNIVNVIITSFIFGLGIDYSIFIMRGLLQKYKLGLDNLSSYKTAIILSATTTLIGIGVLIIAQHPALRSIASVSIIGISSVFACSFLIQPRLFNYLVYKKAEKRKIPLTFLNMLSTLQVYIFLIVGCIILSIVSLILKLLFFIPIKHRKHFLHYLIQQFSKFYLVTSFRGKMEITNTTNENFDKPAMVIANHKSLIDTPMFFRLRPKILIITNEWVNKNPLYSTVCKMADFYSIGDGAESILEKLKEKIDEGYSIAVFPEGTRSFDEKLLRFKKGAFLLAEELNLDIVPMFIHGTGDFLKKNYFWGRPVDIKVEIGERIKYGSSLFGANYSETTKNISRWYKKEWSAFLEKSKTTKYLRNSLIMNYLYKGPVVEHYMKVKTRLEDNYQIFDELIPKTAKVTDLGCGYGFMSYMLALRSDKRHIIGVDYDEEKINVANHTPLKNDQINFVASDVMQYDLEKSDVFIMADMIHYLTPDEQFKLLDKVLKNLNPNGSIILRDGDADKADRHKGTKLTEIFSTNFGFNKTRNDLHFISGEKIKAWAKTNNLNLKIYDDTKFTSNVIFVMKKHTENNV